MLANLYVIIYSISFLLILLECVFNFIPRSHGVGFAYADRNWRYYYQALNEDGYRDNLSKKRLINGQKLLFVGDSFTEGQGIKKEAKRYSNIVYRELSACYEMYNLGKRGMSSLDQLELVENLNMEVDVMVFQYFGNDIEGDAKKLGFTRLPIIGYADLEVLSKMLVKSSYLLNYLYWLYPKDYLNGYLNYLEYCYTTPEIFNTHEKTLEKLKEVCKEKNIRVYVLILPFLQDIGKSNSLYISRISRLLDDKDNNFQVIPIGDRISEVEKSQRIINSNDPHASEYINKIIAEEIMKEIEENCH